MPRLKVTAAVVLVAFSLETVCQAAPVSGINHLIPNDMQPVMSVTNIINDPSKIDIPFEHATVKEFHKGTNGKLIIHIQDAHANYGAQKNMAETMDYLMKRYEGLSLVLSEGGEGDASLGQVRDKMPFDDLKIAAKRLLFEGVLSGHEYLNLTLQPDMTLMGIEDSKLYDKNLLAYAALTERRSNTLQYLHHIQTSLNRIKNRVYPKELIRLERVEKDNEAANAFIDTFEELNSMAQELGIKFEAYPLLVQLNQIKKTEKSIDFARLNSEQAELFRQISERDPSNILRDYIKHSKLSSSWHASQYLLIQHVLKEAERRGIFLGSLPEFQKYINYLEQFNSLKFDDLLNQIELLKEAVYRKLLIKKDLQVIRAIDRYIQLLKKAYCIQMTSEEFQTFLASESDFPDIPWQGFLNQKLAELEYFEDFIPYQTNLEDSKPFLKEFYQLVDQRDIAFIQNSERIMNEEKRNAAFLIAGGYHTAHLGKLLKTHGYSYLVLSPAVTGLTDQSKYEEVLLASLNHVPNTENKGIAETKSTLSKVLWSDPKSDGYFLDYLKKHDRRLDHELIYALQVARKRLDREDLAYMAPIMAGSRSRDTKQWSPTSPGTDNTDKSQTPLFSGSRAIEDRLVQQYETLRNNWHSVESLIRASGLLDDRALIEFPDLFARIVRDRPFEISESVPVPVAANPVIGKIGVQPRRVGLVSDEDLRSWLAHEATHLLPKQKRANREGNQLLERLRKESAVQGAFASEEVSEMAKRLVYLGVEVEIEAETVESLVRIAEGRSGLKEYFRNRQQTAEDQLLGQMYEWTHHITDPDDYLNYRTLISEVLLYSITITDEMKEFLMQTFAHGRPDASQLLESRQTQLLWPTVVEWFINYYLQTDERLSQIRQNLILHEESTASSEGTDLRFATTEDIEWGLDITDARKLVRKQEVIVQILKEYPHPLTVHTSRNIRLKVEALPPPPSPKAWWEVWKSEPPREQARAYVSGNNLVLRFEMTAGKKMQEELFYAMSPGPEEVIAKEHLDQPTGTRIDVSHDRGQTPPLPPLTGSRINVSPESIGAVYLTLKKELVRERIRNAYETFKQDQDIMRQSAAEGNIPPWQIRPKLDDDLLLDQIDVYTASAINTTHVSDLVQVLALYAASHEKAYDDVLNLLETGTAEHLEVLLKRAFGYALTVWVNDLNVFQNRSPQEVRNQSLTPQIQEASAQGALSVLGGISQIISAKLARENYPKRIYDSWREPEDALQRRQEIFRDLSDKYLYEAGMSIEYAELTRDERVVEGHPHIILATELSDYSVIEYEKFSVRRLRGRTILDGVAVVFREKRLDKTNVVLIDKGGIDIDVTHQKRRRDLGMEAMEISEYGQLASHMRPLLQAIVSMCQKYLAGIPYEVLFNNLLEATELHEFGHVEDDALGTLDRHVGDGTFEAPAVLNELAAERWPVISLVQMALTQIVLTIKSVWAASEQRSGIDEIFWKNALAYAEVIDMVYAQAQKEHLVPRGPKLRINSAGKNPVQRIIKTIRIVQPLIEMEESEPAIADIATTLLRERFQRKPLFKQSKKIERFILKEVFDRRGPAYRVSVEAGSRSRDTKQLTSPGTRAIRYAEVNRKRYMNHKTDRLTVNHEDYVARFLQVINPGHALVQSYSASVDRVRNEPRIVTLVAPLSLEAQNRSTVFQKLLNDIKSTKAYKNGKIHLMPEKRRHFTIAGKLNFNPLFYGMTQQAIRDDLAAKLEGEIEVPVQSVGLWKGLVKGRAFLNFAPEINEQTDKNRLSEIEEALGVDVFDTFSAALFQLRDELTEDEEEEFDRNIFDKYEGRTILGYTVNQLELWNIRNYMAEDKRVIGDPIRLAPKPGSQASDVIKENRLDDPPTGSRESSSLGARSIGDRNHENVSRGLSKTGSRVDDARTRIRANLIKLGSGPVYEALSKISGYLDAVNITLYDENEIKFSASGIQLPRAIEARQVDAIARTLVLVGVNHFNRKQSGEQNTQTAGQIISKTDFSLKPDTPKSDKTVDILEVVDSWEPERPVGAFRRHDQQGLDSEDDAAPSLDAALVKKLSTYYAEHDGNMEDSWVLYADDLSAALRRTRDERIRLLHRLFGVYFAVFYGNMDKTQLAKADAAGSFYLLVGQTAGREMANTFLKYLNSPPPGMGGDFSHKMTWTDASERVSSDQIYQPAQKSPIIKTFTLLLNDGEVSKDNADSTRQGQERGESKVGKALSQSLLGIEGTEGIAGLIGSTTTGGGPTALIGGPTSGTAADAADRQQLPADFETGLDSEVGYKIGVSALLEELQSICKGCKSLDDFTGEFAGRATIVVQNTDLAIKRQDEKTKNDMDELADWLMHLFYLVKSPKVAPSFKKLVGSEFKIKDDSKRLHVSSADLEVIISYALVLYAYVNSRGKDKREAGDAIMVRLNGLHEQKGYAIFAIIAGFLNQLRQQVDAGDKLAVEAVAERKVKTATGHAESRKLREAQLRAERGQGMLVHGEGFDESEAESLDKGEKKEKPSFKIFLDRLRRYSFQRAVTKALQGQKPVTVLDVLNTEVREARRLYLEIIAGPDAEEEDFAKWHRIISLAVHRDTRAHASVKISDTAADKIFDLVDTLKEFPQSGQGWKPNTIGTALLEIQEHLLSEATGESQSPKTAKGDDSISEGALSRAIHTEIIPRLERIEERLGKVEKRLDDIEGKNSGARIVDSQSLDYLSMEPFTLGELPDTQRAEVLGIAAHVLMTGWVGQAALANNDATQLVMLDIGADEITDDSRSFVYHVTNEGIRELRQDAIVNTASLGTRIVDDVSGRVRRAVKTSSVNLKKGIRRLLRLPEEIRMRTPKKLMVSIDLIRSGDAVGSLRSLWSMKSFFDSDRGRFGETTFGFFGSSDDSKFMAELTGVLSTRAKDAQDKGKTSLRDEYSQAALWLVSLIPDIQETVPSSTKDLSVGVMLDAGTLTEASPVWPSIQSGDVSVTPVKRAGTDQVIDFFEAGSVAALTSSLRAVNEAGEVILIADEDMLRELGLAYHDPIMDRSVAISLIIPGEVEDLKQAIQNWIRIQLEAIRVLDSLEEWIQNSASWLTAA